MTGRSPKGITAQGNTLCLSSLTNRRAVSAKGASEMLGRPSFCSFRAQVSSFNITQGAAPGLYSYWAFSPSLLATSKIAQDNVQQPMLRAMTGRSPKGITAQGNTLGLSSLTNWRAVSATGASEMFARSFLLLFQSASLLEHLYPGRCPGLYSYWAFSPPLLATSTAVRWHGYTPVGLSARLCSVQTLFSR